MGVLVATVVRNPTAASQVIVLESSSRASSRAITRLAISPSALVQEVFGTSDQPALVPALALLLAYVGVLYLAVRRWAIGPDLT